MTNEHETRQHQLMEILSQAHLPTRGDELAKRLGVTRQVVVHDIALLRASGAEVVATPRGYYLDQGQSGHRREVLAVRHKPEQTATELYALVDHGISIVNVQVEHPVYGELTASLRIASRLDVDQFLSQVKHHHARLLSDLTDGYHMHLVDYAEPDHLQKAVRALSAHGIQVFS